MPLSTGHFFGWHSQQQQQQHAVAGLARGLGVFFMTSLLSNHEDGAGAKRTQKIYR